MSTAERVRKTVVLKAVTVLGEKHVPGNDFCVFFLTGSAIK